MAKNDIAAKLARRNAISCDAALDKAYNNMFGLPSDSETIVKLPLHCLHPYANDPFKDRSGIEMERLAESIRENGLQYPIIVRQTETPGQYEILAGRRRANAMKHYGETEVDAIIRDIDDDEAIMIVTETNLRCREKLLPSEKAFAYKLQLDAIKRQGKRTDLDDDITSTQFERRSESACIIAKNNSTDKNDVRRHIRLTYLITPMLDLIDDEVMPFIAGVNISYLDELAQGVVYDYFFASQSEHKLDVKISDSLRKMFSRGIVPVNRDNINALFADSNTKKNTRNFSISRGKFKKFAGKLPNDTELERLFFEFLEVRFGE